ncbi:MAG: LysM peptidoglycan-binding domain-containing protein [Caldilineaceae bacterium]
MWAAIGGGLLIALLFVLSVHSTQAQESVPTGRGFSLPVIQPHTVSDPNAFIYTVRQGEYWILIARKFGVTYDELRAENPELWALRGELIWPGDEMSIPGLTAADKRPTEEYTVQPGDSWYRIAGMFGVSYWDLRLDNLGLWQRRGIVIRPGDQMQIVNPPQPAPAVAEESQSAAMAQPANTPTPAPTAATPAATQPATESESAATPVPAASNTLPPSAGNQPPFQVTNPPADAVIYSVRPGDSWFAIAGRYGMTFEKLRGANLELWALRGQNIRPADQMIIPAHGSPPPPLEVKTAPEGKDAPIASGDSYSAVEGDTWTSVAARAGLTVEALKAANVNIGSRELKSGDVIQIP